MKRFLTLLAATLLAALPFQAARAASPDPASASRESRDYQLRSFEGLDISWTYKVELSRDSRYHVSVEACVSVSVNVACLLFKVFVFAVFFTFIGKIPDVDIIR